LLTATVFAQDVIPLDRVIKSQPGDHRDALRLEVTPETGAHMDTLTYYFPVVDGKDATLRFHWGTVIVPLAMTVPMTHDEPEAPVALPTLTGATSVRGRKEFDLDGDLGSNGPAPP